MGKVVMAVCDIDNEYRDRFVTYLVEHKSSEYAVHAFSKLENFLEATGKQVFDIAILGRGFDGAEQLLREMGIARLYLRDTKPVYEMAKGNCCMEEATNYLTEQTRCNNWVADEPFKEAEDRRSTEVFRYQTMEGILREVQVLVGGKATHLCLADALKMEVIGVYSPIGHEMQMPFSLVFAEMLSEKREVLYLNLMRHSAFLQIFHMQGEYDLGDVVIRLRNKRLYAETFLRSVYNMGRVSYIPPFDNPDNLEDFSVEDYFALLEFIEKQTNFETVLIDFGDGLGSFSRMLEACTSVYCPTKRGFFFECRQKHFLEYLDKSCGMELCERMHFVNLPYSAKHIRGGSDVYKQLLWSEFGDYVRGYFNGGAV